MYSLTLKWLSFNVSIPDVVAWVMTNHGQSCAGCSGDENQLSLWFSEKPSDDAVAEIQAYWNGLTEDSPEATSYLPAATIAAQIATLRTGLLTKSWDQMSVAERKLVTGQTVTRADLGL